MTQLFIPSLNTYIILVGIGQYSCHCLHLYKTAPFKFEYSRRVAHSWSCKILAKGKVPTHSLYASSNMTTLIGPLLDKGSGTPILWRVAYKVVENCSLPESGLSPHVLELLKCIPLHCMYIVHVNCSIGLRNRMVVTLVVSKGSVNDGVMDIVLSEIKLDTC